MGTYILSNENRVYAALEASYGMVPGVTDANRLAAVRLRVRQEVEKRERRDKVGGRTFTGLPAGLRRHTTFGLTTYMTDWKESTTPAYGPLFEGALGGAVLHYGGGTTAAGTVGRSIVFSGPHGLVVRQAVRIGGEIRFVSAVNGPHSVEVNAPFSLSAGAGAPVGPTFTYFPGPVLRSVSLFDYWSPAAAVQRILPGAGIDRVRIDINGDYHGFEFSGKALDVWDSGTFETGKGGLASFPAEPSVTAAGRTIVPGHLGQAWLGAAPNRMCTLTRAAFVLENDLEMRDREFGCGGAKALVPGQRTASLSFDIYEKDDEATRDLYSAARNRTGVPVMFQLGQSAGQLFGLYMPKVVPEMPEFDDAHPRLAWSFADCRAEGTLDDEVVMAVA
jgi:hypothetical protein